MDLWVNLLSGICLGIGGMFGIIGGIGVLRFPDLFTRLHAASITDTLCAGMIILGLVLQAGWTLVAVKLILILVFLLFTSPVSAHALAKAALHGGVTPLLDIADGRDEPSNS